MKKHFLFVVTVMLLLCACNNTLNPTGTNQAAGYIAQETVLPENNEKEEDIMKSEFITKEDFIKYIQTHDIGLSVEDFEFIYIEDFIVHWHITKDNIESNLSKIVSEGYYLEDIEQGKKAKYMAREKYSVDSTNEEFERFTTEFFKAINKEVLRTGKEFGFTWFDINDNRHQYLWFAQTKDINGFYFFNNPNSYPKLLEVVIENGPDGAGIISNFCYSKNKKFIMLASIDDEQLFEYVKVFCEIDD